LSLICDDEGGKDMSSRQGNDGGTVIYMEFETCKSASCKIASKSDATYTDQYAR
jgi:hypothetical protein